MDINSVLIIVASIVLLGVAGGCVFATIKVKQLTEKLDSKVAPTLDKAEKIAGGLVPAVGQLDSIMGKVNITLDSLDVTLVELDGTLAKVSGVSGMVISVCKAVPEVTSTITSKVKGLLPGKH